MAIKKAKATSKVTHSKSHLFSYILKLLPLFLLLIVSVLIYELYKKYVIHQTTFKKYNIENNHSGLKFYKCEKYDNNNPTKKGLIEAGYSKITDKSGQWELYIPCGYNYVEDELMEIDLNKVVGGHTKTLKIFGIDGCDRIASKNYLWKLLVATHGREGAKHIMPLTYQVADEDEMKLFQTEFQEKNIYILKKNIQQKKGIKLMKGDMNHIKKVAQTDNYKVIQTYLHNPFLIRQRKVNLRIYLVIICYPMASYEKSLSNDTHQSLLNNHQTNKKQTITKYYLYREGKCIYTNKDYQSDNTDNITDEESHLTSVNLDTRIYNTHPESFQDLQKYLSYHYGRSCFTKLWNNILELMKLTATATQQHICQYQNINQAVRFQVFGGDIILAEEDANTVDTSKHCNIKPYLLEFNKGPSMKYNSPKDEKMKTQLYTDLFCLVNVSCQEKCKKNEFMKRWIELN